MNSPQYIWDFVLEHLSGTLTETSINTWFSDCTPVLFENNELVVMNTIPFKRDQVLSRYKDKIDKILFDLFSSDAVKFVMLSGEDELKKYLSRKSAGTAVSESDNYTFDNFIVGNSNRFAYAAAQGVCAKPGCAAYNPLFIYGQSGLGKTHLLKAIGQEISKNNPHAKIVYIKGDEFTNQMIQSIRGGTAEEFRQKYRNADLFLIDDIQFISGKDATQEEFFHTFNNIYESGHQICITSDRPPRDLATLDDRLRTRFEGSLMVDIKPPDYETRIAITLAKSVLYGVKLKDEIAAHIAECPTVNIRQIEGVVKQLAAFSNIDRLEITVDVVDQIMSQILPLTPAEPSPSLIIEETARFFCVLPEEITGKNQTKGIAQARHVAMYLVRTLTGKTFQATGDYFGRDHSTVKASVKKVTGLLLNDKDIASAVDDIINNIKSRQSNM